MKCYSHNTVEAVGICSQCHKGLCKNCCQESNGFLACSDQCSQNLKEKEEINERAKVIYGIGKYAQKKTPLTGIFFISLGLLFSLWGVYDMVKFNEFLTSYQAFLLAIGVLFILFGALFWNRTRKTGLNL